MSVFFLTFPGDNAMQPSVGNPDLPLSLWFSTFSGALESLRETLNTKSKAKHRKELCFSRWRVMCRNQHFKQPRSWSQMTQKHCTTFVRYHIIMSTFSNQVTLSTSPNESCPRQFQQVFEGNTQPFQVKYIYILKYQVKVN